jgi:hypothetical protein
LSLGEPGYHFFIDALRYLAALMAFASLPG